MDESLRQLLPEEKLLIALCRIDFSDEQKSDLKDLMMQIRDWDYFVKLSNKHGIIALSWYNITHTGNSENIPKEYLERLHNAYLINLARNTYLYNQLDNVLELIKDKGFRIVLLKGMALERFYYGNLGLRQMTDIDILVSQDNVLKLQKILIQNGFRSSPYKSGLYKYLIPYLNYHIPRLSKEDCHIEIHCKLFDQTDNSLTESLFENAIPEKISHSEVFIPGPQLFFLYLLSHLKHHETSGDSQVRLYTDLFVLLDSRFNDIINEQLIVLAKGIKIDYFLATVLYFMKTYWKSEFPDWVIEFTEHYDLSAESVKFLTIIRNPGNNPGIKESSNFIKQIRFIPGFFRKFIYVTGFLIPSIGFMRKRYNLKTDIGVVLYYPIRWYKTIKYLLFNN